MERLTVAPSHDRLLCGGREWFYLADTAWSVFTNASENDWREYLDFRAAQGFTAVQVDLLPQWDRSSSRVPHPPPFATRADGRFDLDRPDAGYFDRAEAMVRQASEAGIRTALVLLWANYVPGTWCSKKVPDNVFRQQQVEPFVRFAVGRFVRYEPLLVVSGDTDFKTPEAIRCYETALAAAKSAAPRLLTTFHISGMHDELPDSLAASPDLDLYMYQSCHFLKSAAMPYELAAKFLAKPVRRPVVNGEPNYEGIKAFDGFHRFGAFEVRRASWQSFLAGATAGIAYGAHGIWCWQAADDTTSAEYLGLNNRPFPWRTALAFRGADDVAFMKSTVEAWNLHDARPADLVTLAEPAIRSAMKPDRSAFAVYSPCATDLPLSISPAGWDLAVLDLENRRQLRPRLDAGGRLVVTPHINGDFVLVGRRATKEMNP